MLALTRDCRQHFTAITLFSERNSVGDEGTLRRLRGFRCRLLAEEMRHMGRHQQPHQKQTYTNKQSGSKLVGGEKEVVEEGEEGKCSTVVECFHVLMPPPPLCSVWADITHETVMTIKRPTTP